MSRRSVAGASVAFLVATTTLVGLAERRDARPRPGPRQSTGYVDRVSSLNAFRRGDSADAYEVEYGFIDHQGESHEVGCRILRRDHQRLTTRFGYSERALEAQVAVQQQAFADAELLRLGLAPYFRIDVSTEAVQSRVSATPGVWSDLPPARVQDLLAALQKLRQDVVARQGEIETALYREHGFRLEGRDLSIDYPGLVQWSAPALDGCAKALRWAGAGYDERQYLGMFVAFLQEIRYEVPPDVQNGKETLGLWVPTEVVANDHGDCDSKAVTFCALWRAFAAPTIVVILPRHVLVGVAMPPGPGQQFVRVGNRYYVLCEVAGPGKSAPGSGRVQGSFRYMTVD
jgi:hypothetical protein